MNIDLNNMVRLVLKSMGVAFFVYAISSLALTLPGILTILPDEKLDLMWILYLLPSLTWLMLGLFLWFFPKPVANTIVAGASHAQLENFEIIAISLVGLIFVVIGLSALGYDLIRYINVDEKFSNKMTNIDSKARLVRDIIMILFGSFFVLRGRGIANIIKRFRDAGLD